MLRLRDVMSTDLVTLDPELTLAEAMRALTSRHVSGAPVVAGDTVVGVLSATDILTFASSTPPRPTERWESVDMTELEETADWEDGNEAAGTFFSELWSDVSERFTATASPEWDLFAEHTVDEAMTRVIISRPSATTLEETAQLMRQAAIHRVLVIDGGALVGIVTTTDISAAVADGRLATTRLVFGAERKVQRREWE
jgi:CBS domain-containing protein